MRRGGPRSPDCGAAPPDFAASPKDLGIVLEHPPNESVRAVVEAGAGVTVISKLIAANPLKTGLLVVIAVDLPERLFFVLRRKECCVTQAERELLSIVVKGQDKGKLGQVAIRIRSITDAVFYVFPAAVFDNNSVALIAAFPISMGYSRPGTSESGHHVFHSHGSMRGR
jgi:hypothetical protein